MPTNAIELTNVGNRQVAPPVRVQLGIWDGFSSTWQVLRTWDDFTGNAIWEAGATWKTTSNFNITLPTGAPTGRYKFRVAVDPNNAVQESNEANNSRTTCEFTLTP